MKHLDNITRTNNWLTKNITGFALTSFFNDFSHEMVTAVLPQFVTQLVGIKQAPQALGLITGISNFISSLLRPLAGLLSDKISQHKLILAIGYATTPLFVGLIGTANHIWQIIVYRTIAWSGRAIREPVRDSILAGSVDKKDYGKAFGFVRSLDTLGAIVGPLVAFYILKNYKLNSVFIFSFIPGTLSVLSLIFFVSESNINDKNNNSKNINNTNKFSDIFNNFKKLPKKFINFNIIMLIFGAGNFNKTFIILKAQQMLSGNSSFLLSSGLALLLYSLFNLIRALSEYLMGYLGDYKSKKILLSIFGLAFFSLSCLLLIIVKSSIILWAIIFIISGISTGTVTTLEKAYAADLLPQDVKGTGYGLLQATDGLADLISSILIGSLWTYISSTTGFIFAASLSSLSAILLILI